MKNSDYWISRFDTLNEHLLNIGEHYCAYELEAAYRKAIKAVEADISVFYQRFANNNQISFGEAKKWLNAGELAELKWDLQEYIKKAKESALNGKWIKQLENASLRHRISLLESLELRLKQQVMLLASEMENGTFDLFSKIYSEGYYESIYEVQKGLGFGTSFTKLDSSHITSILAKPWATDNYTFSQRIWGNVTRLGSQLETLLTQQFIKNDYPQNTIKALKEAFNTSEYNAKRLVITESAYFSAKSRFDVYREMGVEKYMISATLDKRTSEICQFMDRKVFNISDYQIGVTANPFHPNCRTGTVPIILDLDYERLSKDDEGKYVSVPASMSYKEWKGKMGVGDK